MISIELTILTLRRIILCPILLILIGDPVLSCMETEEVGEGMKLLEGEDGGRLWLGCKISR